MAGDLDELRAMLAEVEGELGRMPRHLAFTRWHRDRVDEVEWLTRAIARMEGRYVRARR